MPNSNLTEIFSHRLYGRGCNLYHSSNWVTTLALQRCRISTSQNKLGLGIILNWLGVYIVCHLKMSKIQSAGSYM